jgi:hypothetical protein
MNYKFNYSTVTYAITMLRRAGFKYDFSLKKNHVLCNGVKYFIHDLRIIMVYRYEGESDPADQVSVYGLETNTGKKGILITGNSPQSDESSPELLKKLHLRLLSTVK